MAHLAMPMSAFMQRAKVPSRRNLNNLQFILNKILKNEHASAVYFEQITEKNEHAFYDIFY